MDILDYALAYAKMGWSVIPLHHIMKDGYCSCGKGEKCEPKSRGKHPAIASWSPYQKEIADEKRIRYWFTNRYKNIGIVTGKLSKILVVDLDGLKAQQTYQHVIGDRLGTIAQKTGGGPDREQDFYIYPEGIKIKNTTNLFGKESGVDIRAEGGYVVAPPSKTKNGYEWIIDPIEMGLNDLLPPPKELLQFLIQTDKKSASQKSNDPDWQNDLLLGVCEPGRNDAAAKLFGWFLLKHKNKQTAFDYLAVWNKRNTPPLTDTELRKVVDSISGREGITCLKACADFEFEKVIIRDSVDGHGDAVFYLGDDKKCVITGKEAISYRLLRSAVFDAVGEYLMPVTEKVIAPILKKVFSEAEHIEKPLEYSTYSIVRHVIEQRISQNCIKLVSSYTGDITLQDGIIYTGINNITQSVETISKKVNRSEVIDALTFFGFKNKRIWIEKKNPRLWICEVEKFKRICGES